jgi:hypothetical protein
MSIMRLALPLAGGLLLLPFAALAGGPPLLQRYYPAEAPHVDAPIIAYVAPDFVPPHPAAGQIAYIDPVTQALIPAPAPGTDARPAYIRLPDASSQLRMGRTPSGILFIETNGYHETLTATLDATGDLHVGCKEPGHRHAPTVTPPAGREEGDR